MSVLDDGFLRYDRTKLMPEGIFSCRYRYRGSIAGRLTAIRPIFSSRLEKKRFSESFVPGDRKDLQSPYFDRDD